MNRAAFFAGAALVAGGLAAAVLLWPRADGVVVYCALDQDFSEPIFRDFEQRTGIHVKPEYDGEMSKTVGLANKLKMERGHPRCDVFWSNEILQTVRLALDGTFEAYRSPSAADVPAEWKDPEGLWTGFAARPRILILSADPKMWPDAERPRSMKDLADPRWKGRAVMAQPLSGTTLTHAMGLMTVMGRDASVAWFKALHENECAFPAGNGPAARAVGLRQEAFGFTDIDDFHAVKNKGQPVDVVYPDQGPGELGTMLLPNTIALVRGAPNAEMGRKLIDFVLSREVEARLAASESGQVPLRPGVERPPHVKVPGADFRAMTVDWLDAAKHYDERLSQLEALWSR